MEVYQTRSRAGNNAVLESCDLVATDKKTILKSLELIKKYHFQNFDALIVASALETGCSILYTEDLHHGLLVEKQLQIVNPFI